jgi:type IV pilus assembly protein PilC
MWYKNSKKGRERLDYVFLFLPLIWNVYRNYILSIISSNIWTLVWSWVSIIKSLSLVWKSTNNVIYEALFDDIILKVSNWNKIVDSMQDVDKNNVYFPSDFIQMLSVWEKTANLEEISLKINSQYIKEVDYSLASLTKWLEPIALLIAWVFVLWFAFSIFWAILNLTDTIK